jgi:putative heme-binding domain-containing protein
MAKGDASPVVRLYLASAMQRVPVENRWNVMESLVRRTGDASDQNLPLMYWYASEPLAEADPERAIKFALACGDTMPVVREYMVRRIAGLESQGGLAILVQTLGKSSDDGERLAILRAVRSALKGQRQVDAPAEWSSVYGGLAKSDSGDVRSEATALGVTFGDPAAFDSLRKVVQSRDAEADLRRDALQALLAAKDAGLATTLQLLLEEPALRDAALKGLALYDDPQTPTKLLAIYASLTPNERRAALSTLASRAPFAVALLKAVGDNQIAAAELPADLVRQLHNLKDDDVDKMLNEIWGTVRSTAEDKAQLIAHYRELITKEPTQKPDMALGRAVYAKTCQQCHTLYGVGATIGPDLTGSNRADIDYLLTNVVDPGALIAKEYRSTLLVTVDGRVITGLVTSDDGKAVTVRTATETIVLPKDEIEESELTETSMMPDDQLKQFSEHEILSLVAYLRGKSQVPMRATKENAALFFNGRDLAGWTGDPSLWSVENGEIVGRSSGLEHNSFLLSDLSAGDFKLTLDVRLKDNAGNSGIQFRSKPLGGYNEVLGYQADVGPDWWGKLYEENGRALLWEKSGEAHVKNGDWNRYEIEAVGDRIRTWINGQPCVDLDDPDGRRRGIFALQLHSGPATEVRFRNLQLEVK